MARISVFGIGYVGVVAAACLAKDGHEVVAVDIDPAKVDTINNGRAPIVEKGLDPLIEQTVASGKLRATLDIQDAIASTDVSFVCVGTPSAPDGSVGLTYVVKACEAIGTAIAAKGSFHSVVVRSTIVPGSMETVCIPALERSTGLIAGKDFGVGYYPEFLRESTAIEDYYDPGLIVFGALDEQTDKILHEINDTLPCPCHSVSLSTAEMIKYTSNAWRAVKVTFANEIGNIAKASGVDGQLVMKILCSDLKVNISPYFMRPGFAFGGSCLPKDVRALRHLAKEKHVETALLNAVLEANEAQIDRAETMVSQMGGQTIGMVGISFKTGTDDLRESPLASLASRLIDRGYDLKIYDPFVNQAYAEGMSGAGRGNDTAIDLKNRLVSDLDDLVDSSDVILVGNHYAEAMPVLDASSDKIPMVDLLRIRPGIRSAGTYQGICW
ncbi:nucleotide sugar dehydrogenase [Rhizobium sp. CECT 9324]|uniref:nucleotide sugar dehydrogenase n=1 Tax=Rhizobium sp. CECT 9324 TaxID=2845820 RepID=UPI000DDF9BBE|nr:nucleotide sugar dehydrogenase [Rhizobium sp. CECT 9324]CAH0342084.1 GDP-mannose 6-dehydrogenase [Rhizobium sp. CECT 9324]